MFNFMIKRRGGTFVNIIKRHVVKRQINNLSRSTLPRRVDDEIVKNIEEKDKYCSIKYNIKINNNLNDKKNYSTLAAETIEEVKIPGKIFVNHEDNFAHSILESKEIYGKNIVDKNLPIVYNDNEINKNEIDNYINKSWKSLPVEEMIEAFKKISYYASRNCESITDEKYEKFIRYLITNCEKLTDSEICDILLSISLWPVFKNREATIFKSLCVALDRECVRRVSRWSVNELLLVSDYWYKARLYKFTDFASLVIKKLGRKPTRMTPANLVQYMFYVNVSRSHPRDMYNLEYRMEACVDELDLNELSIFAMGFFKSQQPIRNSNLLIKIIRRVIEDIDTIHEIALSAFLKIIRYSSSMQNEHAILWELLVSTVPQVPRLSLQALVHIVTTAVRMRVFHPELLSSVAERFDKEIKDARIKDMERFVLALTCFNFTPDMKSNVFQTIVEELRTENKRADLVRYQKSLANLLQYLSVVNLYPKDLISFILDPENLKNTYGLSPFDLNHAILVNDVNVDAEVPDYSGPRLNTRQRSIIAKGWVNKLPELEDRQLSARHNFLFEIMDSCKEIFGSTELLHLDWVLPQYKEVDVIICLDKNNSLLKVKELLSEVPFGDIKRRPEIYPEGCRWLALVIGAQNCYVRNMKQLLGKDIVKIRQLERIGYTPIVIPWYEWPPNNRERKNYLKEKLFKY